MAGLPQRPDTVTLCARASAKYIWRADVDFSRLLISFAQHSTLGRKNATVENKHVSDLLPSFLVTLPIKELTCQLRRKRNRYAYNNNLILYLCFTVITIHYLFRQENACNA